MKYLVLTIVMLTIGFCYTPAQTELTWYTDINQAFSQAQTTGKFLFVDCYTDWCSWCKKLDQETFVDPSFQETAQQFILLKVNGDVQTAFCTKYAVRVYPTLLFLKADGTEVRRIKGFLTASALVPIMKEVLAQTSERALVWLNDFATAKAQAQQTNRLIFVDCYTDWCSWCKKLDQETFSHPDFQAVATKFVLLKINGDKVPSFITQYNVRYYPTMLFLNAQGIEQNRLVGFMTPAQLVPIMKQMVP